MKARSFCRSRVAQSSEKSGSGHVGPDPYVPRNQEGMKPGGVRKKPLPGCVQAASYGNVPPLHEDEPTEVLTRMTWSPLAAPAGNVNVIAVSDWLKKGFEAKTSPFGSQVVLKTTLLIWSKPSPVMVRVPPSPTLSEKLDRQEHPPHRQSGRMT